MMQAAEEHRAALAEWRVLVGDVPIDWALEHRREIREQAARLRDATVGPNRPTMSPLPRSEDNRAELAHVLLQRLQRLKTIGAGGESFPLLLDDALVDVDSAAKATLLELLMKASANQQVIYLTEDPDVASWARVEALTGQLAIVEPAADRPVERAAIPRRRRSNHIAVYPTGSRSGRQVSPPKRGWNGARSGIQLASRRGDPPRPARRLGSDPPDLQPRGLDLDGDLRPRARGPPPTSCSGSRPGRAPTR